MADQVHGAGVDEPVFELHVGVVGRDLFGDFAPHATGVEDVGLINGGQQAATGAGGFEAEPHDPLDLVLGVGQGVDGLALAVFLPATLRLAEVDAAVSSRSTTKSIASTVSRLNGVLSARTAASSRAGCWRRGPGPCAGRGWPARASRWRPDRPTWAPPTAPNKTASCERHISSVSSRRAVPCASIDARRRGLRCTQTSGRSVRRQPRARDRLADHLSPIPSPAAMRSESGPSVSPRGGGELRGLSRGLLRGHRSTPPGVRAHASLNSRGRRSCRNTSRHAAA